MERTLEAVYERGILTPLEPLNLPERQRITIAINVPTAESPEETLLAWQQVYEGLSDQDVAEVECIALDRSRFMRQEG